MNKHLSADQAVALLESLRTTVRDFRARAEKLNEEFRVRSRRELQRRETLLQEQTQQHAAQVADAQAAFERRNAEAQENYEQRKVRIGKAYQASKEQGLQRIENKVGARKYELQKRMLQAERDRDSALANAAGATRDFKDRKSVV